MQNINKRNYGIDILRMLSMYMVIILHIMGQGGLLDKAVPGYNHYYRIWFFEIASYCAVNCYALVSGYVMVNSRFKLSNLAYLWLQVFFYSFGITFVYQLFILNDINIVELIKSALPVYKKSYWYFSSYFGMFFFIPMINNFVKSLNRKSAAFCIFLIFMMYSVCHTFAKTDIYNLNRGYSTLWLSLLYFTGACIKYHGVFEVNRKNHYLWLLVYIISIVITFVSKVYLDSGKSVSIRKLYDANFLIKYTSPTIFISAIGLLLFFAGMEINSGGTRNIINKLSPLSFSVYLIHVHPVLWRNYFKNSMIWCADLPHGGFELTVLCIAVTIFISCMVVDTLRKAIFDTFNIRDHLIYIEKQFEKMILE